MAQIGPTEITRSPSRSNWSQIRARELLLQGNPTGTSRRTASRATPPAYDPDIDTLWAALA